MNQSSRTQKWLITILVIIIVLGGVSFAVWYFLTQNETSPNSTASKPTLSPVNLSKTSKISNDLLTSSGIKNGVSVGYQPKEKTGTIRSILGIAKAEEKDYTPVLFYTKNIGKLPQIYFYQFADASETQITSNATKASAGPVFSSISQKLAYVEYPKLKEDQSPNYSFCDLVIYNLQSRQVVKTFEGGESCIGPFGWSPDGKKLLMISHKLGTQETSVKIYNAESDNVLEIKKPAEELIATTSSRWIDNDSILLAYMGSGSKTLVYKLKLADNSLSPMTLAYPNARNFQLTPREMFYLTTDHLSSEITFKIAKENLVGEKTPEIIAGTEVVYDFLAQNKIEGNSDTVVYSRARNSEFSQPEAILSVNLKTHQVTEHMKKYGDAVLFIGWLSDYNHVIYWVAAGGSGATSSSISVLDLSTNQVQTVTDGLSLIQ